MPETHYVPWLWVPSFSEFGGGGTRNESDAIGSFVHKGKVNITIIRKEILTIHIAIGSFLQTRQPLPQHP